MHLHQSYVTSLRRRRDWHLAPRCGSRFEMSWHGMGIPKPHGRSGGERREDLRTQALDPELVASEAEP